MFGIIAGWRRAEQLTEKGLEVESRFIRKCDLLCLAVIFVTCLWFYLEDFEIIFADFDI